LKHFPSDSQRHEGDQCRKGLKALRGEKALKENPKSVSGMKHGREVLEEGNGQEGAKP